MIKSFVSPKIEIHDSNIHGVGMFAIKPISKGEVVFIHGGHIVKKSELFYSKVISSYLPLDDDYFIGALDESEEKDIELFVNHSCNPNCGMRGEITFVAMRKIQVGEELTIDYSMVDNEEYSFVCLCKSRNCRKVITGFDWKLQKLQNLYKGYFSKYISDKIDSMNAKSRKEVTLSAFLINRGGENNGFH